MSFKPKILAFLCNWCSYAGADLAGVSRIQYPPNIRIIRVMCSGRIDPKFIFKGLDQGADGVLIMGCHPGDCHYISGNYEAIQKYDLIKKLLEFINLADRVKLEWVSASEGARFAEVVTDFTKYIKGLGPLPLKGQAEDSETLFEFKAVQKAADTYRTRALVGRKRAITEEGNVYDNKLPEEEFETIQNKIIEDEFVRQKILLLIKDEPLSVINLGTRLKIDTSDILKHVVVLKSQGLLTMDKVEGITPFYLSSAEV